MPKPYDMDVKPFRDVEPVPPPSRAPKFAGMPPPGAFETSRGVLELVSRQESSDTVHEVWPNCRRGDWDSWATRTQCVSRRHSCEVRVPRGSARHDHDTICHVSPRGCGDWRGGGVTRGRDMTVIDWLLDSDP